MQQDKGRSWAVFSIGLIVSVWLLAGGPGAAAAQGSEPRFEYTIQQNVMIPMRDGVRLAADLYLPKGTGPFPVIIERTPYDKTGPVSAGASNPTYYAARGYAVVVQDVRGRYASEGAFYPFHTDAQDGYDTVEWAARQSWSNGKVCTIGGSYTGRSTNPNPNDRGAEPGLYQHPRRALRSTTGRGYPLTYTTEPLAEDVEVTGPVTAVLYASSTALDTDWVVKLCDVDPTGYSRLLTEGILRAWYRDSKEHPTLLVPGTVYPFTIDLWATSNLFKKGHRIRVTVSSSNFPRYDRNPNTGHEVKDEKEMVVAVNTIYHDPDHPSHLVLPIIPRR